MTDNMKEYDGEGFLVSDAIDLVDGLTGPSGTTYVKFQQWDRTCWIRRADFADSATGFTILKANNILCFTSAQKSEIVNKVSSRTYFPAGEIAEKSGWSAVGFGYPNGRVFAFSGITPPIAYKTGAICVTSQGSLADWRRNVARFVRDHHLLVFCIMAAFAAPLLSLTPIQGNFLLMLSGLPRKGKTTCVDLMASVCGPALDSAGGRYYLKFNNTMNRIEEWLPAYSDLPLIIDELSSHGTKSSRMTDFRTMVHHLAGVDARGRMGDELVTAFQTRTVILMTSNDTARELLGLETAAAAEAVEDRLIELPVPRGEEGAFNGLPPDAVVASQYSDAVRERVGRFHGTAMPAFLEQLVQHRQSDEAALRAGIDRRMTEFANFPEVQRAGRISARILNAMGLVYAAGMLAKHYRIIPRSFDCRAAAIHCLGLHLGLRAEADPVQRLLAWVTANNIIDLRAGNAGPMSDAVLWERGAFAGVRSGVAQLWIHPRLFRRVFTDYRTLLASLESRGVLQTEGKGDTKHKAIHCPVRREKSGDRMYVFNIPEFTEWLENNGYPHVARGRRRR